MKNSYNVLDLQNILKFADYNKVFSPIWLYKADETDSSQWLLVHNHFFKKINNFVSLSSDNCLLSRFIKMIC